MRKTAAVSVAKLHNINATLVEEHANAAVVLSGVKVLMKYMERTGKDTDTDFISTPLVALLSSESEV